ncbi:sel1 repeat family protein [Sinorhizobium medicae]|nr:sel1 repeat family protein [Sinorhizobium medicae]
MNKHVKSSLRIGLGYPLAAILLLALAAMASSTARAGDLTAAEQCDREAGSELDVERNRNFPAVATKDIRIGVALSACREAYNQNGGGRTQFQLARVLDRAGQKLQSAQILEQAAQNGHASAMVSYADLLAGRGDLESARRYYQRAAGQGNALAARSLAVALRDTADTSSGDVMAARRFAQVSADPSR